MCSGKLFLSRWAKYSTRESGCFLFGGNCTFLVGTVIVPLGCQKNTQAKAGIIHPDSNAPPITFCDVLYGEQTETVISNLLFL